MTRTIKLFLAFEAVAFLAAALVHSGALTDAFAHRRAGIAETTIGALLLAGLAGSLLRPHATRAIGLTVQGFALLGTLVGLVMVAIGVGPQTAPDLAFHAGIALFLVTGLMAITFERWMDRGRRGPSSRRKS